MVSDRLLTAMLAKLSGMRWTRAEMLKRNSPVTDPLHDECISGPVVNSNIVGDIKDNRQNVIECIYDQSGNESVLRTAVRG
jgi:hypothetical protein